MQGLLYGVPNWEITHSTYFPPGNGTPRSNLSSPIRSYIDQGSLTGDAPALAVWLSGCFLSGPALSSTSHRKEGSKETGVINPNSKECLPLWASVGTARGLMLAPHNANVV